MEKKLRKNIYYVLQFTNSARFIASSVSNLAKNPSEGIYRIKCKFGYDDKKCETYGIKYKYCNYFLKCMTFKDDLTKYKCLCCNKSYKFKFDEKLKERFFITYKFFKHDNNKSVLLLQKGVYPYEYMDDWEKFNETSLPEKEDFCSLSEIWKLLLIHTQKEFVKILK